MKVWITKYALTRGIYEIEAEPTGTPTMVADREDESMSPAYYHKPFWQETKEEAVKHALKQIEAKRVGLATQLKKLDILEQTLKKL